MDSFHAITAVGAVLVLVAALIRTAYFMGYRAGRKDGYSAGYTGPRGVAITNTFDPPTKYHHDENAEVPRCSAYPEMCHNLDCMHCDADRALARRRERDRAEANSPVELNALYKQRRRVWLEDQRNPNFQVLINEGKTALLVCECCGAPVPYDEAVPRASRIDGYGGPAHRTCRDEELT